MKATSIEACRGCEEPVDVLTLDEEGVLKSIREIVAGIRANYPAIGVADVEAAVISIGGTVSTETDGGGDKVYELRSARFSLSADPSRGGAIQLSFIPAVR